MRTEPPSGRGMPANGQFERSFRLHQGNMRAFIAQHGSFEGKFVFNPAERKLGLYLGERRKHAQIALTLGVEVDSKENIGGKMSLKREAGQLTFTFYDRSEKYGTPSPAQFEAVADYLMELLSSAGFSAEIASTSQSGAGWISIQTVPPRI